MSSWNGNANLSDTTKNGLSEYIIEDLNAIIAELEQVQTKRFEKKELQSSYFQLRKYYKHIELFIEHVSPLEARYYINGALVPKYAEAVAGNIVNPCGFQKIEEYLFDADSIDSVALTFQYSSLHKQLSRLRNSYLKINLQDNVYLEMMQLQLYRMSAMSFNGYDATFTKTNLEECAWNFDGMLELLVHFESYTLKNSTTKTAFNQLKKNIQNAQKSLLKETDYDRFNRLAFIVNHINGINKSLIDFHQACHLPWSEHQQALHLQQGNLFSEPALNPQFFSLYYTDTLKIKEQAALGKILFYDPILSSNNERACASCHNPNKAFTDGLPTSLTFNKSSNLTRNTPSIVDVIFQKAFFYDGKAYHLEKQVFDVVHNQEEMGGNLQDVVLKLRQSDEYKQLFQDAFLLKQDAQISAFAIQKSLAEYEKTLISFNSRFDAYINGERQALNQREINGYNLFAGKALCGSCHFFPIFNGTVPPLFNETEYEIIGSPATKENKILDKDLGRFAVTKLSEQRNAFKTPTVRNAAITAPYMHNGIYTDLDQVLDFYKKGGGKGLKYEVTNQTLPFDSLQLTKVELDDIRMFLFTLSDTSNLQQLPFQLPQINGNPALNNRIWGGNY